MTKKIAMLLCIVMLLTMISGCRYLDDSPETTEDSTSATTGSPGSENPSESATENDGESSSQPPETQPNDAIGSVIDYDAAFSAFSADTVMIRTGDYTVTWEELFFFLHNTIESMFSSIGTIESWDDSIYGDMTMQDMVMAEALDVSIFYNCLEYGAADSGVTLSEESSTTMKEQYTAATEQYGGEEAFLQMLWQQDGIHSKEMYEYLLYISVLANQFFADVYGQYGEKLSDEDVAEYTADGGYLMAKHILRLKPDHSTHDEANEADACEDCIEGKAGAQELCAEILTMLNDSQAEGTEFDEYFDELMATYSEDTGLTAFPDGYLFQNGDMVSEFYDTCIELEIGDFSESVETSYGYHIIYRIPIDFDQIPSSSINYGDYRSLRETTAYSMFDSTLYGWKDLLTLEYTDEFNSIDFPSVFKINDAS